MRRRMASGATARRAMRRPLTDMVGLGGWVMADVLVGLLVIALVSIQGVQATPPPTPVVASIPLPSPSPSPAPAPTPSPTPVPTPSPAPSPSPSPTPSPSPSPAPPLPPPLAACETTVRLVKHEVFARQSGPGREPTAAELLAVFAPYAGQRAGLVLTFGYGVTTADRQAIARQVNAQLPGLLPEMFRDFTEMENLRWESTPQEAGNVQFWVYFINDVCR